MVFNEFFEKIREQFQNKDTSNISGFLAIQINITGTPEESGTFYIEVKDGKLAIEPYAYDDRNVVITISAENFDKLINGKLDPVFAFTTGKLKADGDLSKALELKKFI